MAKAKKSFTDINPALQFISAPASNTDNTSTTQHTYNADNTQERKTKRLNLLMQPSLMDDISKLAHMRRTSVNELISTVLRDHCGEHEAEINEWERIFGNNAISNK